jgi:hypothetical protein
MDYGKNNKFINVLKDYITANGWVFVSNFYDKFLVYQKDDVQIQIPANESFSDYKLRISETLQQLQQFYSSYSKVAVVIDILEYSGASEKDIIQYLKTIYRE